MADADVKENEENEEKKEETKNKTTKKGKPVFNVTAAIRELMPNNVELSGTAFLKMLKIEHPKQKINESTFKSTWSNVKKKMLNPTKGKKKSTVKKTVKKKLPATMPIMDTAISFVKLCGGFDAARKCLESLEDGVKSLR